LNDGGTSFFLSDHDRLRLIKIDVSGTSQYFLGTCDNLAVLSCNQERKVSSSNIRTRHSTLRTKEIRQLVPNTAAITQINLIKFMNLLVIDEIEKKEDLKYEQIHIV
jgi:hypothetical protein